MFLFFPSKKYLGGKSSAFKRKMKPFPIFIYACDYMAKNKLMFSMHYMFFSQL